MVYPQTNLRVVDNSGVKFVRCVQVVKKRYRYFGKVGSLFVGVVTSLKSKVQRRSVSIKKGSVVFGIILTTKKETKVNLIKTGSFIKSQVNSCVLIQKKNFIKTKPMQGNRVQYFCPFLVKQKGFYKVYSVSDKYVLCKAGYIYFIKEFFKKIFVLLLTQKKSLRLKGWLLTCIITKIFLGIFVGLL